MSLRLTGTPGGYKLPGMIQELKKRSLHRSRILQGQMRGLEKMIENEDYCIDILTQSLAIQKSLRSLNKLLLENHLKTHLPKQLQDKDHKTRQKALRELLSLYELSNVRT